MPHTLLKPFLNGIQGRGKVTQEREHMDRSKETLIHYWMPADILLQLASSSVTKVVSEKPLSQQVWLCKAETLPLPHELIVFSMGDCCLLAKHSALCR